ncbi:DUF4238 domain-containing protein [Halobacteria archaeon AArc-curdl1]|uniref:DUF4238 domain-containing protein n=1 Tax=Natronosalvus hydrolyticus TaxID=2979988 RepID=A0AAP3E8Q1_9EURY|nr:DUF4238 domain-containing protein [Halobacteria archaeon AArc-curdl1]
MPERKNQHYVPQFYLDAWATDEKVDTLHLESGNVFDQHLTKVCARNYFYSINTAVEEEFADLEGFHSGPIKRLRNGWTLTDLTDKELKLLYSFVTTQRFRTKAKRSDIEEGDEFFRDGARDDLESGRYEDIIKWKGDLSDEEKEDALVDASILGIHHRDIAHGIFGYIGIGDLEAVMLRNVTSHEFVVSDSPVVHENPAFKERRELKIGGLANRGLQIYCPIGPDRMLLLYDSFVYSFDSNSKHQVLVKSENVVDELNLLQFHSAENIVMFDSCSEEYVQGLLNRMDEVRRREEITFPLEIETGETLQFTEVPHHQLPRLSPSLPDCTINTGLSYTKERSTCQAPVQRKLVHLIFNESHGASDVAVIYSIRLLQELLDLERYDPGLG